MILNAPVLHTTCPIEQELNAKQSVARSRSANKQFSGTELMMKKFGDPAYVQGAAVKFLLALESFSQLHTAAYPFTLA